jgi:hypothetical protein
MAEHITQFQIDDEVLYVKEGIATRVSGYVWDNGINPKLLGYWLACGCTVTVDAIEPSIRARARGASAAAANHSRFS